MTVQPADVRRIRDAWIAAGSPRCLHPATDTLSTGSTVIACLECGDSWPSAAGPLE